MERGGSLVGMDWWDDFVKSWTEFIDPARGAQIRARSEQRALDLILEFPHESDAFIANLMRDELINMRSPHREYFAWARADTVGRIRRTLAVTYARNVRSMPPAP